MTSWNGLCILLTLIFGKTQKLLRIKGPKMERWWTTKEKNFWTCLAILKEVPGIFEFGFKNKTQIYIFREFLIMLLRNISFPKSFLNALAIFLAIYQTRVGTVN